jgi:hypothetical protein
MDRAPRVPQLSLLLLTILAGVAPTSDAVASECSRDEQCGEHRLCVQGRCRTHRRQINLLYLFYLSSDRTFSEALGIYWQRTGERGYAVGFPLYWNFWTQTEQARVFFPFYFDFRDSSTRERQVIVPPVQVHRSPVEESTRVWPLLFHHRSVDDRESSLTFVPFLHHARSGKRTRTVLPLFLSFGERDPDERQSRGLVAGTIYWAKSPGRWSLAVMPLFYHRHTPERAFTWALPLTFQVTRPGSSITAIAPLLFHVHEPGSTILWTLAPPLLYRSFGDHRRSIYLPPLVLFNRDRNWHFLTVGSFYHLSSDDGHKVGLAPLFFEGRSGQDRHLVVFPVLWHFSSPTTRTLVAGPFFHRSSPDSRQWGLAPLLFGGQSGQDRHLVAFPVLWRFASADQRTIVAGPVYHRWTPSSRIWGVAPLLHGGSRGADESHLVLFPVLWNFRTATERTLVAGPVYYRSLPEARYWGFAPLLHGGHTGPDAHLVLFPVLWHFRTETSQTLVVPPFFLAKHDQSTTTGLVPLVFHHRDPDHRFLTVLPLFATSRRPAAGRSWFVSPLFLHGRDTSTGRTNWASILPLIIHYRDRELAVDAVPPLFARWVDRPTNTRTTIVPPLVMRADPRRSARVFFPLFWRFTDRERQHATTVLLPVYHRRTPESWSAGVAPLLHFGASSTGQGGSRYATFFPLFHVNHSADQQLVITPLGALYHEPTQGKTTAVWGPVVWRGTRQSSALAVVPLFWRFRDDQAGTATTLAGPLLVRRRPDGGSVALLPLFYADRHEQARRVALLPLFWADWRPGKRRIYTPLFGLDEDEQTRTLYAGLYLGRRAPDERAHAVFPFFYSSRELGRSAGSLWLVPTYYGQWSPDSALHTFFPLFWRARSGQRTATVAAPFVWDFNDGPSGVRFVFPLFLHASDRAHSGSALAVIPNFWMRVHPTGVDAVAFPIFWRYRHSRSQSTVVFPLFWDFQREDKRSTVGFPLFWRFDSPSSRFTLVGNTYYRTNKVTGAYDLNIVPLLRVQRPRPEDLRFDVMGGFFGYERAGRERTLRLLFIPIGLSPAPPRTAARSVLRQPLGGLGVHGAQAPLKLAHPGLDRREVTRPQRVADDHAQPAAGSDHGRATR